MNTVDALEALLDGKTLTDDDGDWFYRIEGKRLLEGHCLKTLGRSDDYDFTGYKIYVAPKPKVMRAQYASYDRGDSLKVSEHLYSCDKEFLEDNVGYSGWFKRLQEIECES